MADSKLDQAGDQPNVETERIERYGKKFSLQIIQNVIRLGGEIRLNHLFT